MANLDMGRFLLVAVASVTLLAIGAVAIALAGRDGQPAGGTLPELDVKQSGSATDQGITVSLTRAHFSGTATFVELEVRAEDNDPSGTGSAVRAIIDPSDLRLDEAAVESGFGGFSAPLASPGVVRLPPLLLRGEGTLQIQSVTLLAADETPPRAVTGEWSIRLEVPGDLASRLRVEHLGGGRIESGGVGISVEGAVRSTSETLLTVRIDSDDPVAQVGQPSMVAAGETLYGGLISRREDGQLLTYSFPPTKFGSMVQVSFGPLERALERTSGSVEIDLAAAMARAGLSGADGQETPLAAADVVRREGVELTPTLLTFTRVISSSGGKDSVLPAIRLTFDGAFPPAGGGEESYSAVTALGKALRSGGSGVGYSKDLTGVVCCPRTEMWFFYDSLNDLAETVTVTYRGNPSSLIRGDWRMTLRP
ncbi:MAG: hypothetical protein C3F10_08695 [Dehalococcoidia bacterium]|nr:MAG: hypothetical protein C3F10_08695 [Dehalococcoidia bacterium]